MRIRSVIAVLLLAVALSAAIGCDRPFVPERAPDISVLSPDPSAVVPADRVMLRIRATSFRPVARVTVDGREAGPDGSDTWSVEVTLERGLNTFVIQAFDTEAVPGVDTLRLVRLALSREPGPVWPEPAGGHTATLLDDGRLFVIGGAPTGGAPATAATWLFDPTTGIFSAGPELVTARTGHTATLLPDGRVVIMGGSVVDPPGTVANLVETVELYDPADGLFREVRTVGDPVRRAFHTASLRGTNAGPVVDVIGGTGDIRYGEQPRLDVRDDLRSFSVAPDSVTALVGWHGYYIDLFSGHTQTALDSATAGAPNRYLLSGTLFGETRTDPRNLILDARDPNSVFISDMGPPSPARNQHAAVRLADGQVLLIGGNGARDALDGGGALFHDRLNGFLGVSPDVLGTPEPRRRFTATFLPDGRILLMGGYARTGQALGSTDRLYID